MRSIVVLEDDHPLRFTKLFPAVVLGRGGDLRLEAREPTVRSIAIKDEDVAVFDLDRPEG